MSETDVPAVGDRWSTGALETPKAFMLIGRGGPNVLDDQPAGGALVVDAEGVQLRSGATYAWCRTGCCGQPRYWPSAEAAADFHGSLILDSNGTIRAPGNVSSNAPGDAVPSSGSETR